MAVNLSPVGGVAAQFFDNSGNVLTGGKLYTYLAGTTTPATTYTTSSGNTAQPNPIVFNAAGRVPDSGEIWLSDGVLYKFSLQDQYGVQIATYDNIDGINSNFVSYTSQNEVQTATQGQTIFTLTTIQYTPATNNLAVYVNGSKQIDPTNYVETGSTTVTFVSGLNVGDIVEFSTATPVATNTTSAANVSYNEGGAGAVTRTVQAKLQETVSVKDFGAIGDGITDDTAAIQAALAASYNVVVPTGSYLISSTIAIPIKTRLFFQGGSANQTSVTPSAYFIKKSTMTTVGITIDDEAIMEGGGLVCQSGNTGDGIQIIGNGSVLKYSFVNFAGGVGVRVGTASGKNCNVFELNHVNSFENGSHGIYIHDGTASEGANANAGALYSCIASSNAGNGIHLGHAWWVTVINSLTEINTGWGLYLSGTANNTYPECRYANIIGGDYNEGNNAGAVYDGSYFSSFVNADGNATPTTTPTGLQGGGYRNVISPRGNLLQGLNVYTSSSGINTFPFVVDNGYTAGLYNPSVIKQKTTASNGDGAGILWSINPNTSSYLDAASISVTQRDVNKYGMNLNVYNSGVVTALNINPNNNSVAPGTDNAWSLGNSSQRWSVIYAATGTINTSDATQKQQIRVLSNAEKQAAQSIKLALKAFKFNDAVEKKGDKARIHFGVIAQEVKEIFAVVGLDAENYGLFCSDTLEDGSTRLGIRYDELLAFIISTL